MKYQSLVSSTTPADLQEWLGQELEDRCIDSVYARSVLSLLQQDCVDIEPKECQHFQNKQLKVMHKYGGPENLYSATKSKHQKWKTWGKQMLLTSSSCCRTVISDLERIKKQTAVDCLRSASDYVNDIEELIDEVWIKLNNIKNLKGEKEEIHLRNITDQKVIDPFFIPPSSPTDEIKKYFAAFPSLNEKLEKETDIRQLNNKNAWCKACVIKKNRKSYNIKCNQPIIPYSPLKQIKAIYQSVGSPIFLKHNKDVSLAFLKENKKNCVAAKVGERKNCKEEIELTKQVLSSVKGSWNFITKTITLSFEHLYFIQINLYFLYKENNSNSYYDLKFSNEEPNSFINILFKSYFVISNFDKSSNQSKATNLFSNLVSFHKKFLNYFNNSADFKDSVMSMPINNITSYNNGQSSSQYFGELCAPYISEMNMSLVKNTSNLFEQPTNLRHLPFEGNIGSEKQYNLNLLPSYNLVANNEMLYSVNVARDSHLVSEGLHLFIPSNLAYQPIQYSNYLYDKNLLVEEKDCLHLKEDINTTNLCVDNVINYKEGQQLLKKVLFINKMNLAPQSKASPQSRSIKEIASLIHLNNETMSNELISQSFVNSNENTAYVHHSKDTVQASCIPDYPHKSTKTFNEKWLLYWGDNHNFIAHTWQKDLTPSRSVQNIKLLNDSESIKALSKEIREDGDELLKGLDSIPSIADDPIMNNRKVSISDQNDFHSNLKYNSQTSSDEELLFLQQIADTQHFVDLNNAQICSPVIDNSFTSISVENVSPQILHSLASQNRLNLENNYFKATDYTDLSALPNSYESVNSIESDFYVEGGGWSFEDSFLGSSFAYPNDRCGSLDDLDIENSEYSEIVYEKRIRCTSETDDDIKQLIRKQNQSQIQKRFKQKIASRNRPCLFFLQGNCSRSDCKYSHDFSTTTCRFWKEGSCFKGATCPFLHGYIKEFETDLCKLDQLRNNEKNADKEKDNSYSLESEADFPSLSFTKSEPSKSKSTPINIVHLKDKKKF